MEPQKINWTEKIAASGGKQVLLPDEFKGRADDIEAKRKAFNDLIKKVAEKEIELNMTTQTMFYDFRKYLAASGRDDVWTKEIGLDAQALTDGLYVVNLREQQR